MQKSDIINAYVRIRTIDQTIPDDVLDFMKNASIKALQENQISNFKTPLEVLKSSLEVNEFNFPIWTETSVIAAMEKYANQFKPTYEKATLEAI